MILGGGELEGFGEAADCFFAPGGGGAGGRGGKPRPPGGGGTGGRGGGVCVISVISYHVRLNTFYYSWD